MVTLADYGSYRVTVLNHALSELQRATTDYLQARGVLDEDGAVIGEYDSECMQLLLCGTLP